ncbi:hypothetical protein L1987_13046 [Smallanthus sonchifolius]|uniref:Uncharacterized protein n=1 Tax=Smallanthus sonchifolius TaxID=185202 RepID=A0ACB9JHM3_9ASTR|nr:hypothetical protein L1987_13046 [Smallanthus sonchifolius]
MLSGILCEETGQMSGVPQEVIQRAAFILDATTKGIHIDRAREEKITVHDDQYKVWAVLKPGFLALLARSFWYQALSLFLMCYHLQMEIKKIKCIWLGK